MIIRQETKQDFKEVYKLVKDAFETARVSNGKEQDFVNEIRAGEKYIPELSLVVEEQKRLIAHIILSKFNIKGCSNPKIKPLLLNHLNKYISLSIAHLHISNSLDKTLPKQSPLILKIPTILLLNVKK